MREAAIDNDFVIHIAELHWEKIKYKNILVTLFNELQMKPVMHELVYLHELKSGAPFKEKDMALFFFDEEIIDIKKIESIIDSEYIKYYYEVVFREIYRDFIGELPDSIKDIYQDWKSHISLGETHTAAMCAVIDCDIFLSDDKGSVKLAKILKSKFSFDLKVKNREDVIAELVKMNTTISKKDRRAIKHKAR